jgi:hypothetical protein
MLIFRQDVGYVDHVHGGELEEVNREKLVK